MKKILIIDNYDSFTYNLVHLLKSVSNDSFQVLRNDKIDVKEVNVFDKLLISPGPGIPSEAGVSMQIIEAYAASKSILGVCLGHQAIAEAFGGKLLQTGKVYHGIATPVSVTDTSDVLFRNIPDCFDAGRYHSWLADRDHFSKELRVTAEDREGNIMALAHRQYDVKGLQFHPESILTSFGKEILENWINN